MKTAGIQYTVPRDYYDISDYEKTDAAALKIASSWYYVLGSDLYHRGISLGQMMENDLYYIFVDALRSKKIAEQIMLREEPEITYGPPEISFQEPITICYEFLPGFLRIFSSIKGKKYFIIDSPALPVICEETKKNLPGSGRSGGIRFTVHIRHMV
jgi:hypothetical protein